jgi:hypothetical protein
VRVAQIGQHRAPGREIHRGGGRSAQIAARPANRTTAGLGALASARLPGGSSSQRIT